ncbi:MAG: SsrA-binding protein SmpB [Deltaproteobacteria bacterium]|nr:SsrA-binding protein SmpB [Deltaproteobacteria bacterium]
MSQGPATKDARKIICQNRRALHEYFVTDRFEAGLVLTGSEVKSLRAGKANLGDAHAEVRDEELFLVNCHISPYSHATHFNHEPLRARKLLMHKQEIRRLATRVLERGFTLIPLSLYFLKGKAKVELGLAKGKKHHDKREAVRERDERRDLAVEMARRR